MTLPLFTLLGFAVWTLLVLMDTIGVHRWRVPAERNARVFGLVLACG